MDLAMFELVPKIKTKLHIVMVIDNGYVFDAQAQADLKQQLLNHLRCDSSPSLLLVNLLLLAL